MKIRGNCYTKDRVCPFLRRGLYHSGFTSKGGEATWWRCKLNYPSEFVRNIKKCFMAGNWDMQKETYINKQAKGK